MKIVALGLRRSSVFQTFYIAFLSFKEILTRIGEGKWKGTVFLGL